ncbi:MAG: hypothetical protein ACKOCT_09360, partial [Alphaproteobacteria bacterium]
MRGVHRLEGLFVALVLVVAATSARAVAVDYDVVYVRQPRYGDTTATTWPEVFHPAQVDPGADLVLLHPDGSEEVLVEGGIGSVTDPFVSFDAQWVYYAYFHDARPQSRNPQRGLFFRGSDVYRVHLATRRIEQLTHGEFTPNTGAGNFDESNPVDPSPEHDSLGYGILNLGPAPVAGGKIAFTSNRNGFAPPKGYTNPTLQLFVMDEDGSNVTQVAPMNLSSALHPTPLADGRLLFSSHESEGLRDARMWGLWAIWPDGRHWEPVVSAFHDGQAFHFATQLSGGDLVVVDYYNLNNAGFGALFRLPLDPPPGEPRFFPAFLDQNPPIEQTAGAGFPSPFRMPFTPRGFLAITPFTTPADEAAPVGAGGVRVGKFTHPSAAPGGDLLVAWTPGPANDLERPVSLPRYDSGLYLLPGGGRITAPSQLVRLKNDPRYNEAWPRAVVRYRDVHGVDEPARLPWLPNDGTVHPSLPPGTPYGLVGTSSFYKRESFPGQVTPWSDSFDGLDAFNTRENGQSSNWFTQGSDAGRYANEDVWAVRLLAMEPGTHRSYGPNSGPSGGQLFRSHAGERLRILGEIPLRKRNVDGSPLLDPEGNPDTSFLARIPADTPFTFQALDRDGLVLTMAQTWHQLRPGEMRADCGGCHAHGQAPLAFESTAAALPGWAVADLTQGTVPLLTKDAAGNPSTRSVAGGVVDVEFVRDVRPILQRSCVPCHAKAATSAPGSLVLDDLATVGGLPGDYARLAADPDASWGLPPVAREPGARGAWRQTNASRYLRPFQSRRSLLAWKVFGRRLDGWSNADHPTESVPGDPSTLPAGASPDAADLDFTGTIMPPPGSGVPALTEDEKMTIARWIDLGAPIDGGPEGPSPWGWFLDEVRPTLALSSPRAGANALPLARIAVGVADANSGIAPGSLSVVADVPLAGRAAGQELADLLVAVGDGRFELALDPPVERLEDAHLRVHVADGQGNVTSVDRRFWVGTVGGPTSTCAPAPRACATVGRASLSLGASPRKLAWTAVGQPLDAGVFGDPVGAATGFAVCAYDGTGASILSAAVAAGPCTSSACWTALGGGGFRYRGAAALADGLVRLVLKPSSGGRSRIRVEGAG